MKLITVTFGVKRELVRGKERWFPMLNGTPTVSLNFARRKNALKSAEAMVKDMYKHPTDSFGESISWTYVQNPDVL
jgi:hypothetical protein